LAWVSKAFSSVSRVPSMPSEKSLETANNGVFPYRFFSHGNYFGDYEILMQSLGPNKSPSPHKSDHVGRKCSVRCESEIASVLVLCRQEFLALLKDFPHFGDAWYVASRCREQARLAARKRLTRGMACRHFAAHDIQRLWRWRRKHGHLAVSGQGNVSLDWVPFLATKSRRSGKSDVVRGPSDALEEMKDLVDGIDISREVTRSRWRLQPLLLHEARDARRAGRGKAEYRRIAINADLDC
jgi:hypothetical protein